MKDKKKIVTIILIILVLITILAVCLNLKNENKDDFNDKNNNVLDNNGNNEKNLEIVNDYKEFFSIQNSINSEGNLNTSYVITELYLKKIATTKYFFINCSILESDIGEETINYQNNNYYLLIVGNNNRYEIMEINEDIDDLVNYAKNYGVSDREIISNKILEKSNISQEKILSIYIEYFKDMLILDTELAYTMITEDTKSIYADYTEFYNDVINNYNKLSSKIFSYSEKDEDNKKVFYIEDDNRNKVIIYEENIMNFKISF